jgi:hypothetical protein
VVKNLSRLHFGREASRMANERAVLRVIELATGKSFAGSARPSREPNEEDPGHQASRTMITASRFDRTATTKSVPDLRIAAFVEAITRSRGRMELGSFRNMATKKPSHKGSGSRVALASLCSCF